MNWHIAAVVCVVGLLFAGVTIELVRRKYLRPEYALLWGGLSLVTLLLALVPRVVLVLVAVTGMTYTSSVIVLVFLFTALVLMNFSVIVSRQGERIVRLTQEVALLKSELSELRRGPGEADDAR
jgi:hypothetical protein